MEEERRYPEHQRSELKLSLETCPGAWPRGLALDTEVCQGTSPGHPHVDASHLVQGSPTSVCLSIWDSVLASQDAMQESGLL